MRWLAKTAVIVATMGLAACGPTTEQIAQQQAIRQQNEAALAKMVKCEVDFPYKYRSRETTLPAAQCYLAAELLFCDHDEFQLNRRYKDVAIAEAHKNGLISEADYDYLIQQSAVDAQRMRDERITQKRILAAQERQARAQECLAARRSAAKSDARGMDSPNGAVAVISLLGVLGSAASVVSACD